MNDTLLQLTAWGVDLFETMERFCGDTKLYLNCLHSFIQDPVFPALEQAITQKDYTAALQSAHTLKGVCGNLGLCPMYQTVCTMVEKLRKQDFSCLDVQAQSVFIAKRDLEEILCSSSERSN